EDLGEYDVQAMRLGVAAGYLTDMRNKLGSGFNYERQLIYVCWTAHNSGFLREDSSFHIGYAAALLARFGTAACLGEARHATQGLKRSRNYVYNRVFDEATTGRTGLARALWLFKHWPWNPSYGGPKWEACTAATITLDREIRAFVRGESSHQDLIGALNVAVDQAHNGGWWLNKWANGDVFDQASAGHPDSGIKSAPVIWEVEQMRREM